MLGVFSESEIKEVRKLTHLVLGRIRKLHPRFQRLTAGIVFSLLPFIPGMLTHEWPTDSADITKSDSSNLQMGAPKEADFSLQNSPALIPFTSKKSSNSSTGSLHAIPKEPQDFSRDPYDNHILPQTKNNLELFVCIALRQVGHSPA
jgi:hypothetical protein